MNKTKILLLAFLALGAFTAVIIATVFSNFLGSIGFIISYANLIYALFRGIEEINTK